METLKMFQTTNQLAIPYYVYPSQWDDDGLGPSNPSSSQMKKHEEAA
jgi:hypothetical protein